MFYQCTFYFRGPGEREQTLASLQVQFCKQVANSVHKQVFKSEFEHINCSSKCVAQGSLYRKRPNYSTSLGQDALFYNAHKLPFSRKITGSIMFCHEKLLQIYPYLCYILYVQCMYTKCVYCYICTGCHPGQQSGYISSAHQDAYKGTRLTTLNNLSDTARLQKLRITKIPQGI